MGPSREPKGLVAKPAMGKHATLWEMLEDDDYPPERPRKRSRGTKGKRAPIPSPSAEEVCKELDDLLGEVIRYHERLNWFSPVVLFLAPPVHSS